MHAASAQGNYIRFQDLPKKRYHDGTKSLKITAFRVYFINSSLNLSISGATRSLSLLVTRLYIG